MTDPFFSLYEQHASETAFLWQLWRNACGQPQHNKKSLITLEKRIFNHIAALLVSPDIAWELCAKNMEYEDAGEVFAAAQVAFRTHKVERIKRVVDVATKTSEAQDGLVSAMEWLPNDICHPWIKKFFESKGLEYKAIALRACIARGENPGKHLNTILSQDDCIANQEVYTAALQCVGVFKRKDLLGYCLNIDLTSNFWALYACILLGSYNQIPHLKAFVFAPGKVQQMAINLSFRCLPIDQARAWISELAKVSNDKRNVVYATGILGDPHAVPWLIQAMREPFLARMAGDAFSQITGTLIADTNLEATSPFSLEEALENDSIDLDNDEHLPWPNPPFIEHLWQTQLSSRFISGDRYFLGDSLENSVLKEVLDVGYQRQREYAAYELAMANNGQRLASLVSRQTKRT